MDNTNDADECSGALPLLSADSMAEKCDRCGKPSSGLHSCPYASEINDNDDPEYCNCCDDCTHECCMDI
jgi:hypothetical protein